MNVVTLVGNLGKDPEVVVTQGGLKIAKFSIATSRTVKGEKVTDWHNITVFDKQADVIEKYVKKGDKVGVVGTITYDTYENKEGVKQTRTVIIASQIQLLTPKGEGTESSAPRQSTPAPATQRSQPAQPAQQTQPAISDDDLPF